MNARQIQEDTAKSIGRTIATINDTEHIAGATLEELSRQREVLEKTEENLDAINVITRATQKHLTSMKSIFSTLFSRSSAPAIEAPTINPSTSKSASSANYPSLVVRPSASTTGPSSVLARPDRKTDNSVLPGLDQISDGVSKLRDMALMLGNEIDDQNSTIDRIGQKAERADDTIKHQNRQMERILKS